MCCALQCCASVLCSPVLAGDAVLCGVTPILGCAVLSVLNWPMLWFAVVCCAVLCCLRCAVLCCAVLCCAVLCCAVLCCAVLRCAALCCAALCRAALCCAVQCCSVPCCALLCWAVLCWAGKADGMPASTAGAPWTRQTFSCWCTLMSCAPVAAGCGGLAAASRRVTQTRAVFFGPSSIAASVTSQQTPSPTQG